MEKILSRSLLTVVVVSLLFIAAHAKECGLKIIDAKQMTKSGDVFIMKGKDLELSFPIAVTNKVAFRGPALTIKNTKTGKSCIIEKGLALNDGPYLSMDEQTVVLFQMRNVQTVVYAFYRTDTCEEIGIVNRPAGSDGSVEPNKIILKGHCDPVEEPNFYCTPATVHELDSRCQPIFNEKASLALTKEIYGVEFSTRSKIASPRTSKARLLKERERHWPVGNR